MNAKERKRLRDELFESTGRWLTIRYGSVDDETWEDAVSEIEAYSDEELVEAHKDAMARDRRLSS